MGKVWFTADTHFGHERTLELSKRPYKNVEEMDNDIIQKWNSVVKEDDTVYHLGDFGNYDIRKLLNGKIILLYGNYEVDDVISGKVWQTDLVDEYKFDEVEGEMSIELNIDGLELECIHEPSNSNTNKFRLFGHIHKLQMVKRNGLNVGVDCHNFYPIDLETVKFYKNAIENHYDEEVFDF